MPAAVVFSGLSPLVAEDVVDDGGEVVVWPRTPDDPAACPGCGAGSARVHGYHWRRLADLPLDGRPVIVNVQFRRLVCPTAGCRNTFREQVAGVLERYQRRTTRLTCQAQSVVRELAGQAGARLLDQLSVRLSRNTAVRVLLGIPLPQRCRAAGLFPPTGAGAEHREAVLPCTGARFAAPTAAVSTRARRPLP